MEELLAAGFGALVGALAGARAGVAQHKEQQGFLASAEWYREVGRAIAEAARHWERTTSLLRDKHPDDQAPPEFLERQDELAVAIDRFREISREAALFSSVDTLRELRRLDAFLAVNDDLEAIGEALRTARVALVQEARRHIGVDWVGRHELVAFWHTPDTDIRDHRMDAGDLE